MPWIAVAIHGGPRNPMVAPDNVNVEIPIVLRDRIAANRRHPRQAYHEVIEEALLFWEEGGAWAPHGPLP